MTVMQQRDRKGSVWGTGGMYQLEGLIGYRSQQKWRRHMGPLPQVHGEPQSMHKKRVRGALTSQ